MFSSFLVVLDVLVVLEFWHCPFVFYITSPGLIRELSNY